MQKTHTNATPYTIPLGGNTTDTHTVIEEGGVKTDGKCVWCCGEVLQGAILLVFQPLTYINASEKLLKRHITDPTVSTEENNYNLAVAGSVQ